jgi:hypothetical protein
MIADYEGFERFAGVGHMRVQACTRRVVHDRVTALVADVAQDDYEL